jgi:hypothetical protein
MLRTRFRSGASARRRATESEATRSDREITERRPSATGRRPFFGRERRIGARRSHACPSPGQGVERPAPVRTPGARTVERDERSIRESGWSPISSPGPEIPPLGNQRRVYRPGGGVSRGSAGWPPGVSPLAVRSIGPHGRPEPSRSGALPRAGRRRSAPNRPSRGSTDADARVRTRAADGCRGGRSTDKNLCPSGCGDFRHHRASPCTHPTRCEPRRRRARSSNRDGGRAEHSWPSGSLRCFRGERFAISSAVRLSGRIRPRGSVEA